MANDARTQFIDGLRVTADHLQHLQDRLRDAMRDVRQTIGLGRVAWGLHVTVAADSAIVTPGVAFAPSGIRLNIDTDANLPIPSGAGPWRVTLKATEQDRASLRVGDKPTLIQLITSVAIEPAGDPAPGEDALVVATITGGGTSRKVTQDPGIFAIATCHAGNSSRCRRAWLWMTSKVNRVRRATRVIPVQPVLRARQAQRATKAIPAPRVLRERRARRATKVILAPRVPRVRRARKATKAIPALRVLPAPPVRQARRVTKAIPVRPVLRVRRVLRVLPALGSIPIRRSSRRCRGRWERASISTGQTCSPSCDSIERDAGGQTLRPSRSSSRSVRPEYAGRIRATTASAIHGTSAGYGDTFVATETAVQRARC
jgi:hypothetical protein